MANFADRVQALRNDIVLSMSPTPSLATALKALDNAVAALGSAAEEESAEAAVLAKVSFDTLSPDEAQAWVGVVRAKAAAVREAEEVVRSAEATVSP